jgi:hypothetical protein
LAFNKLTGNLDVVDNLKKLGVIYMRNNSFTGAMPSIPSTAVVVDLDNNKLTSFPIDVCKGTLPGAYTGGKLGCSQDWPTQDKDSCCVAGNMFACPAGTTTPPKCLANCGATCQQSYKCVKAKCVPVQQGGGSLVDCQKFCG